MPKIETPEDFVSNQIIGHKHDDAVAAITARDAAIRAESAELLRVCGEALAVAHKSLEHSAPADCWAEGPEDPNNPEHYDHTCPGCKGLAWIDRALAALKGAGVKV